jgi:hypothetical protein
MSLTQSLVQLVSIPRACSAASGSESHAGASPQAHSGTQAASVATGTTTLPKPRRRGPEVCCSSARQCPNCPRRNVQS